MNKIEDKIISLIPEALYFLKASIKENNIKGLVIEENLNTMPRYIIEHNNLKIIYFPYHNKDTDFYLIKNDGEDLTFSFNSNCIIEELHMSFDHGSNILLLPMDDEEFFNYSLVNDYHSFTPSHSLYVLEIRNILRMLTE